MENKHFHVIDIQNPLLKGGGVRMVEAFRWGAQFLPFFEGGLTLLLTMESNGVPRFSQNTNSMYHKSLKWFK